MKRWIFTMFFSLFAGLCFLIATPGPVQAETLTAPSATPTADVVAMITPAPRPTVLQGQDITYTLAAVNYGPDTADLVSLAITLPEDTVFKSLDITTPGCAATTPAVGTTGTVFITKSSVNTNDNITAHLVVTPSGLSRTITATCAVVSATIDPNPGNNTSTASLDYQVPLNDLSLTVTDNQTTTGLGTNSTYNFFVMNVGVATAENIRLTAVVPAGFTIVSPAFVPPGYTASIQPGNILTVTGPSLMSGYHFVVLLTGVSDGAPGIRTITGSVTSDMPDIDPTNNTSTDTTEVVDTPPTIVDGMETALGSATPAAMNGNPAVVPYSGDMSGWFADILNRPLSYLLVSAYDDAAVPNDVSAQVGISGSQITYTPAPAQAGRSVTLLIKANNGLSDSAAAVSLIIQVNPIPLSNYQIEFDPADGTPAPLPQTLADGSKIVEPAALVRSGYTFAGWYISDAATTPWDFAAQTVNAPMTLHARWTAIPEPIPVTGENGPDAYALSGLALLTLALIMLARRRKLADR